MLAFYPQIKLAHVACVAASGALFLLRGAATLAGARWPMALSARLLSYAVDIALLTVALMLVVALPAAMFANGWLAAKLMLLPVYIVLGSFALKRAATTRMRAVCFFLAVGVYLAMVSIARTHDPLGPLRIAFGAA